MEHVSIYVAVLSLILQLGNSVLTLRTKNAVLAVKDEIKEWAEGKFMPIARCDDRTQAHEHRFDRLDRAAAQR